MAGQEGVGGLPLEIGRLAWQTCVTLSAGEARLDCNDESKAVRRSREAGSREEKKGGEEKASQDPKDEDNRR